MIILQLIFGIVLMLLVSIQDPALLLRPKWIEKISGKVGVQWSQLEVSSKSHGLLRPEIDVRWSRLKVDRPELGVESGAGEIKVELNFRHPTHLLYAIDTLSLSDLRARVPATSAKSKAPQSESVGKGFVPAWLREAHIRQVDVRVTRWEIGGDDGSAYLFHGPKNGEWQWNTGGVESAHRISAGLTAKSESHSLNGPWRIEMKAEARRLSPQLRKVATRSCLIHWYEKEGLDQLLVSCPIEVFARPPTIKTLPNLRLRERLGLLLSAKLGSKDILDLSENISVESRLELSGLSASVKQANIGKIVGEITARGNMTPSKPVEKWKIESNFNLAFEAKKFQRLVRFLDQTPYAVPAPFHSLDGSVTLSAVGKTDTVFEKIPVLFKTRLKSPNQSMDLDANGMITLKKTPPSSFEFSLALTDVRIPLPRLDLAAPPRFLPDPRIRNKPRQLGGQAPPDIEYQGEIKTGENPVLIQTNLAKTPIPVRLDLHLNGEGKTTGTIHVDRFPLNLFRRDAELERFDVNLEKKEKKISGLIKVTYTDYVIHIEIFGTLDHPEYKFISDPPLSDSDVIAVLLFGHTNESLDPTQTQSVGNVQSAVASKSIDLASLYLLSSTPVESVGWDPQSGTFSAKFRLAEGTSLSIAKGQEDLESIGIRKRIGGHWTITTQLGNPVDPTDHSVFALFEWSHRY